MGKNGFHPYIDESGNMLEEKDIYFTDADLYEGFSEPSEWGITNEKQRFPNVFTKKIVPLDKRGFPTVVSNVKYYDVKTDGYEIVNLICYGMFCKYINTQTELYKELYSSKEFKIYGNLQMFDRIILYSDDKKGREQINTDCLNYAKKCTENYKKSITEYMKKQQVK